MGLIKSVPLFIFLAVLLALGVQQAQSSSPVSAAPDLRMVATPDPGTIWNISTKTANESSQKPDYTITIKLPVLQSADGNAAKSAAFNAVVDKFNAAAVYDFKKSAADPIPGAPPGNFLDIRYHMFFPPQGAVNVRILHL